MLYSSILHQGSYCRLQDINFLHSTKSNSSDTGMGWVFLKLTGRLMILFLLLRRNVGLQALYTLAIPLKRSRSLNVRHGMEDTRKNLMCLFHNRVYLIRHVRPKESILRGPIVMFPMALRLT